MIKYSKINKTVWKSKVDKLKIYFREKGFSWEPFIYSLLKIHFLGFMLKNIVGINVGYVIALRGYVK